MLLPIHTEWGLPMWMWKSKILLLSVVLSPILEPGDNRVLESQSQTLWNQALWPNVSMQINNALSTYTRGWRYPWILQPVGLRRSLESRQVHCQDQALLVNSHSDIGLGDWGHRVIGGCGDMYVCLCSFQSGHNEQYLWKEQPFLRTNRKARLGLEWKLELKAPWLFLQTEWFCSSQFELSWG